VDILPQTTVWFQGVRPTGGTSLEANPRVAFTTRVDGVDVIVEGRAEFVTDGATLERVAKAYRSKYGWPLEIRDGEAYAPFAAPAAGPPPFRPYAVTPRGGVRHGRL